MNVRTFRAMKIVQEELVVSIKKLEERIKVLEDTMGFGHSEDEKIEPVKKPTPKKKAPKSKKK